jgi:hypothetical protein
MYSFGVTNPFRTKSEQAALHEASDLQACPLHGSVVPQCSLIPLSLLDAHAVFSIIVTPRAQFVVFSKTEGMLVGLDIHITKCSVT